MLTYSEMHSLIPEIAQKVQGEILIHFMQTNLTSYVFEFRNTYLFICVQKPFSRFHLTHKKYKAYPSSFADQVDKLLRNKVCTHISLLSEDRILCLRFEEYYFIAELMYHRPVLAVTDPLFAIILSNKPTNSPYRSPIVKPTVIHQTIHVTSIEIEKRYQLLEQKAISEKHFKRITQQLIKLEKQLNNYQEEYGQAKNWQILQKETELLKSNLQQVVSGMKSVRVMDWEKGTFIEITLDPRTPIQNQLQARFKKVRKMRKRLEIYPRFIREIQQKIDILNSKLSNPEKAILDPGPSKKPLIKRRKESCFHTFIIDAGNTVLVGKNAKGNQKITFSVAKGNDTWLHVTPMAGSHVIIRNKEHEISQDTLQDAMQLALYFSQARKQNEAEVLITKVKYVSRTRATGRVLVAKHKTKKALLDLGRIRELMKKRVK